MDTQELFARAFKRVSFYARGVFLDSLRYSFYENRLKRLGPQIAEIERGGGELADRVTYYNHMPRCEPAADAQPISRIERRRSYYYFDLKIPAKHFGRARRINYIFGDLTTVPPEPALVKSRPIGGDNRNSVVFKLNQLRHFGLRVQTDRMSFRDKRPMAVWRGRLNNDKRRALIAHHYAHPSCDIGHTSVESDTVSYKPFISVREHLAHRFIISIEGRDVATNLKWIMSSNSLCLMPKPRYETWFMEGRLKPGVHYVELRDDFADLTEKISFYNDNQDEAEAIIAEANAFYRQFQDRHREELCMLAVLHKYFQQTGQL
ncbi:glycosyl transferase family 90 [Oricola sp.]|uniref:glycosyl transferase family 90 n=1 Tax=Oricola sp. TaxID=1979950 RepID=UPI003BAC0E6C